MKEFDEKYCIKAFEKLLAADSTTGNCEKVQELVCGIIEELGFECRKTHKGGVIAVLDPKQAENSSSDAEGNALVVTAHLDDIGLMVRHINPDGTLNVCPVGGLYPFYCMGENVRIYNRTGKVFTGTVCRTPNSIHVTEEEIRNNLGDFRTNVCVVLDEDVKKAEDVYELGIETGDMIALEPRFTMSNGYVKSRFIDDKACAAVLLTAMKAIAEGKICLSRKVYAYFAVYEEVGHGTSWLPDDVCDVLAIDIAPTGPQQTSDEKKVSIFAKDSRFPYHWGMTNEVREAAIAAKVDYVMDVFTPHYGSDGDTSVVAGHDVRHTAIGPGTANSHGYERTHVDGLRNTYELLMAYIQK